jgi:predicted CXXCH cytochrome family protein
MRDPTAEYGWRIPKVHISQRWFSKGEFDHRAHRNTKCEDCHKAEQSKSSEDVLLPGIKVCRDCHGGAHSKDKLASTCITCHKFHMPDTLLMGNSDVHSKNE